MIKFRHVKQIWEENNMELARIFCDCMVLQRNMPLVVWGNSKKPRKLQVKLEGKLLMETEVGEGVFSLTLPPLEAAENVTLEIGEICLRHVDVGEVWIAGGQSNMEFMLQYTSDGEEEIARAQDEHLRMYTVGQYSFAGEREEGYKDWNPWDCWLPYRTDTAAEMSAVGVYFAKELRKKGIPVGIINCTWGGTSASAWMDPTYLKKDEELRSYLTDFQKIVDGLDLDRYYAVKRMVRPGMASRESRKMMDVILKHTFLPQELNRIMMQGAAAEGGAQAEDSAEARTEIPSGMPAPADGGVDLSTLTIQDIMAVGPGDPNEPGALYENMVKEIIGYGARGVIWYQGEADDKKASMYGKLFSSLIACWRDAWKEKNAAMERMPFLFVQLAPFGTWRGDTGVYFPEVRRQQEWVAKHVPDTFMISSSDYGNIFDVHPKEKAPLGQRLALLAEKYVYAGTELGDEEILADAPEAAGMNVTGDTVTISFAFGEGLYLREEDFSRYNGFERKDIPEDLLPPVSGGVNGLALMIDGKEFPGDEVTCQIQKDQLVITAAGISSANQIRVEFARTAFYKVNLFNRADLPAKPFVLEITAER